MPNTNKMLKVSAILYLVSALLVVPFITALGGILLFIGLLLLSYSFLSQENLAKKKVSLIIIIILSFLWNIPSAILLILAMSEMSSTKQINNNSPPEITTSSESKRIDLLLKLGLGMVLISGVLFATTSWNLISDLVKVIALIIMGFIFIGLSIFSEKKLQIPSTTKAYFILGLSFFLLSWIGIGYFGIFSDWFSYAGAGKNLVYFITFTILSIILYLIGYKFKEQEYQYLGYTTIYVSIYHILTFLNLNLLQSTIIFSIISLIINLLPQNNRLHHIKQINSVFSYLYWTIILTQCFTAGQISVLIACIVNIINLLVNLGKKKSDENIITIILSYILILIGILKLNLPVDKNFILFVITALFSLGIKYNKLNQQKSLIITNQIIYNVIATVLIIVLATYTPLYLLIASLIYVVINIINSLDSSNINDEIDYRYQPIVLFIMFMSIVHFININLVYIGELVAFALTALAYAGIYHISKTDKTKKYYYIYLLIIAGLTFILNFNYLEIFPSLVLLVLSIYLTLINKDKAPGSRIFYYIFLLMNIIELVDSIGLFDIGSTMNCLIILIIFIILTLIVRDEKLKVVNYIAIALPLYGIVNSFEINSILNKIIHSLFYLYILFLILKLIIKDKWTRDLVGTIGISIIALNIITARDLFIGLYIGILAIILIFITFNEEEYKKMFYCGIVITVLNIIIQLWDLWTRIPFWLYLLLVGIAIIAFVTYKETTKEESKEKTVEKEAPIEKGTTLSEEEVISIPFTEPAAKKEEQVLQTEKLETANFCPICGTKNPGGKFCRRCGKNLNIKQ